MSAASAVIGEAAAIQFLCRSEVRIATLPLPLDLTIPVQPQTLEGAQYGIGRARNLPWRIDILDTYEPLTALLAGMEKAGCSNGQRAGMELAGGRGGESPDVR